VFTFRPTKLLKNNKHTIYQVGTYGIIAIKKSFKANVGLCDIRIFAKFAENNQVSYLR
jgi:hypothetical protein